MDTIYCKNCGNALPYYADFCRYCGSKLADQVSGDEITPQVNAANVQVGPQYQSYPVQQYPVLNQAVPVQPAPMQYYPPNPQQYYGPQNNYYGVPYMNPVAGKKEKVVGSWFVARLVIGIISIIVCCIMLLQSCAAGVVNIYYKSETASGTVGFFCAMFMLSAGIVNVSGGRSKSKGPNIASMILYSLGAVITLGNVGRFEDLILWGALSAAFAVVNLCSSIAMILGKMNRLGFLMPTIASVTSVGVLVGFALIGFKVNEKAQELERKRHTFGVEDTFTYEGYEITFHKGISVESDTVIKVPVTIKNVGRSEAKIGMFDYYAYDPNGEEISSSLYGVFVPDSIENAGKLQPGASYDKYIYLGYNGGGTYSIVFGQKDNRCIFEFEVD